MKKWTPSIKQLELYEELLKEQNKVRREILRRRVKQERNKSRGVTLPDIVVPKHIRVKKNIKLYRFKSFQDYQSKVRELKRFYGKGIISYYKEGVKKNFLKDFVNVIQGASENMGAYDIKPEGRGGYFSQEQIVNAPSDIQDAMKLYNRYNALSPEKFAEMYENGFIAYLKYIYREMVQGTSNQQISFISESNEMINLYKERVG